MSITYTKDGSKSKESGTDIATASKILKLSQGYDHLKFFLQQMGKRIFCSSNS